VEYNWYIVHALSGMEKKVVQAIQEKAEKNGLGDYFKDIIVPSESVSEIRKGKKVDAEKKFFPGYILINMHMTDDSWHLVKSINKVSGFLGVGGKPQRVPEKEVREILKEIEEGSISNKSTTSYDIGEAVKIIDGPFDSFTGSVEEVDNEKQRLKVLVSIFGRATPVDLNFTQVSKIN
jgi:transcriptional antiterminator NusG